MKQSIVIVLLSLVALLGVVWATADDKMEVLATVGEQPITLQDFAQRYPGLVSWFGVRANTAAVQNTLEQMILGRLLLQEASQAGLANQPEVQAQINELLARAYLRIRVPTEKLVVEEEESQSYYDQHRERFRLPTLMRIAHILVASEMEVQAIRQAVQDNPEAFRTLARERSLDVASAQQGGSLGWVRATQLAPGLAEAGLALAPGQVSGVIKTVFGYHLVRLDEITPPQYQPYLEVQEQIAPEIIKEKKDALMRALKEELWTKYHVVIHQEVLRTVVQESNGHGAGGVEASPAVSPSSPRYPSRQGPQPRLQLLSAVHNLGAIPAQTITYTSLVANSGDAELIVRKVSSPCGCVKATLNPTRLLPGQTGRLTIIFDPNYFKDDGETTKIINLESNDPEASRQAVLLSAEIVRGPIAHEQR